MEIIKSICVTTSLFLSQVQGATASLSQLWARDPPQQPSQTSSNVLPSSPALDLESQLPETQQLPRQPQPQQLPPPSINRRPEPTNMTIANADQSFPWSNILLTFCFTAALEIGLQHEPIGQHSKFQLKFYLRSAAIAFTFVSLIISQLISTKFPAASRVFEKVAIFLAVIAFFIIMACPLIT